MNEYWIPTQLQLPPEKLVVETLSPGGVVTKLVRQGSLWFFPDFSMYVYYTPESWRTIK